MRQFVFVLLLVAAPVSAAEQARIAVASNFLETATALAEKFAATSTHDIEFSSGSSGALYGQVINGAPFDAFLSADVERPRKLEAGGFSVAASRFTYANGRLVLLAAPQTALSADVESTLADTELRHFAIANPRLAPYGVAARQALETLGYWQSLEQQIVLGETIGKTFGLVITGNADLGMVASSQAVAGNDYRYIEIPATLHDEIQQQAVLLNRGADNTAAIEFLAFIRSDEGRRIIAAHGYGLPDSD